MSPEEKALKSKAPQKKLYKVEGGKVVRQAKTCPRCGAGVFMAEHVDRFHCGRCSYTEFKKGVKKFRAKPKKKQVKEKPKEEPKKKEPERKGAPKGKKAKHKKTKSKKEEPKKKKKKKKLARGKIR